MGNRLAGKVAIVTGGSTGIGEGIALKFAAEGAMLVICGRREEPLLKVKSKIASQGGTVLAIRCDVSDEESVKSMIAEGTSRFGEINILVNNAGIYDREVGTVVELEEMDWDLIMGINAKGSWLCCKHVIPIMQEAGGGSIIMISSVSAHVGQPRQGAYNFTKAVQQSLVKCMAIDFATDNIRCNSICPGWIETPANQDIFNKMRENPDLKHPTGLTLAQINKLHPLGRTGTPEDVASAAIYLASDESSWVTGSSLIVDGGYLAQ